MHRHWSFGAIIAYLGAEVINRLVVQAEEWLVVQLVKAIITGIQRLNGGQQRPGWA